MFRALDALRGLAERSILEKFHLGLLSVDIPRPIGECDPRGEVKLMEVKSVSACENALDADSSSTEVSPLSKLIPDTRCGLKSVGMVPNWAFLLAGSSMGSGGIGTSGACPGC